VGQHLSPVVIRLLPSIDVDEAEPQWLVVASEEAQEEPVGYTTKAACDFFRRWKRNYPRASV
jgi:hypothetical protein